MSTVKDAPVEERRDERSQLRAVAPLLSVSAGGRHTSCEECARSCVCVYASADVCVSMRLPANKLTSHGACLLLNFNEYSSGNISFRFSGSRREFALNVFIQY